VGLGYKEGNAFVRPYRRHPHKGMLLKNFLGGLNGCKYLQHTDNKQEMASGLSGGDFSLEKNGLMR